MTEAQDREIVRAIIATEGGFVDNPVDRGGVTNRGVTGKALIRYRRRRGGFVPKTADEIYLAIKGLTPGETESIYLEDYVRSPWFDHIENLQLRRLVIDSGVLHGRRRATRWLQKAVGVKVDGVAREITMAAVDKAPWRKVYCDILGRRYLSVAMYTQRDPRQAMFLEGWVNRANKLLKVLGNSPPSSE